MDLVPYLRMLNCSILTKHINKPWFCPYCNFQNELEKQSEVMVENHNYDWELVQNLSGQIEARKGKKCYFHLKHRMYKWAGNKYNWLVTKSFSAYHTVVCGTPRTFHELPLEIRHYIVIGSCEWKCEFMRKFLAWHILSDTDCLREFRKMPPLHCKWTIFQFVISL